MHKCKIVHEDVSPDNIMFDPATGRVMVIDYELAAKEDAARKTIHRGYYCAPEKRQFKPVNKEADTYACGRILQERFHSLDKNSSLNKLIVTMTSEDVYRRYFLEQSIFHLNNIITRKEINTSIVPRAPRDLPACFGRTEEDYPSNSAPMPTVPGYMNNGK